MKHQYLSIRALAGGDVELLCYGPIGGWPEDGGICARDVAMALQGQHPGRIAMRINSPGGDAFEGIAIYNLLKQNPARVEVQIDGVAASAASVVAMAGDEITMAENALMMMHDPWNFAVGNAEDLRAQADSLDRTAEMLARTYAAKCGKSPEEMRKMMSAETWLMAEEAVAMGLADKTTAAEQIAACAMPTEWAERYRNVPAVLLEVATNPHNDSGRRPAKAADAAEHKTMPFLTTLLAALALQDGADEPAIVAAITGLKSKAARLDELEGLTGKTGPEALGTVKAWQASAEQAEQLKAEKDALELEGQKRDFASALADGKKAGACKLTPATEKHFQDKFDAAENKAGQIVELKSFLAVAPVVLPTAAQKPQENVGDAASKHNGKSFDEMTPIERHRLHSESPEIYAEMRAQSRIAKPTPEYRVEQQ